MCYLCGPDNARASIEAALKVWKRKHVPNTPLRGDQGDSAFRASWGFTHDWTKPPARVESWTTADFTRHQKRPLTPCDNRSTRHNTVGHDLTRCDVSVRLQAWNESWAISPAHGANV